MEFLAMFIACSSAALMLFLSFPFATAMHHYVPAMFIFGDSLADAGTNNFIANTTSKANFPPYGETFFHHPTGRFTNGRTAFDFIASKLGLPFPPPYLKPRSDFSRGINFASGGSGLLDSTGNYLNIIPLSLQIRQFANYSSRLGKKLGGDYYAKEYLSHSLYTINSVGNDIGLNYLANTTFQNSTTAQDFVKLLLSKYNEHLLIPKKERGEYSAFLCKRPEKYVFWDGTHPTEKIYEMVSHQIWEGNTSFITPFNLKRLLHEH